MNSPMMQHYHDAKAACPEALLLFRMGDFYELFYDDAKTAARVLGLTLTSRGHVKCDRCRGNGCTAQDVAFGESGHCEQCNGTGICEEMSMAGFPYHQLEAYLGKLIAAGFRCAVCEQVANSTEYSGMVERIVTRPATP